MPSHPLVFRGGGDTKTNYSACIFAASGASTAQSEVVGTECGWCVGKLLYSHISHILLAPSCPLSPRGDGHTKT